MNKIDKEVRTPEINKKMNLRFLRVMNQTISMAKARRPICARVNSTIGTAAPMAKERYNRYDFFLLSSTNETEAKTRKAIIGIRNAEGQATKSDPKPETNG